MPHVDFRLQARVLQFLDIVVTALHRARQYLGTMGYPAVAETASRCIREVEELQAEVRAVGGPN